MNAKPRRRIFGWMMYDWASQPFHTLCLTFIFGPYFASVATETFMAGGMAEGAADARAQGIWSLAQTWSGLLIAFTAPALGALADNSGRPTRWIAAFSVIYVAAVSMLWGMTPDGSAITASLWAFAVALIAVEFLTIFTNAMLPSLGTPDRVGRISGTGFAVGYAGGVSALFIMLLFFAEREAGGSTLIGLDPPFGLDADEREGTRAVGPFTAIWYVVFMIPFFVWARVRNPNAARGGVSRAFSDLARSLRAVARRRSLAAYLGSSMLYRDALNALYGFGGVYAALVLDWPTVSIGVFGIVAAISAGVATWIGGFADSRLGPKPVIFAMIVSLAAVCVVIVGMTRESILGFPLAEGSSTPDVVFYALGCVIGGAGGVLQSASRTMMARHSTPDRPTEAFGLYALSGKATAFLAPALIGAVTLATENARLGLIPVIILLTLGLFLLFWVEAEGDGGRWPEDSR